MYLQILCKQIARDLSSETLYFNKMWSLHTDAGNSIHGGQYAKNVYLGETRIVTKLCLRNDPRADAEELQQYFYHSDHLGSASLISDYKGDEYQRIEYTPYGETWIERTDNKGLAYLPYKFTAKELDSETGLYYYGARYLDSKYSTWISTDPALGDYIPQAPINDEARKHNQNLPGMGGIFNHINCNLYAYGTNNPVRYIDPDGRKVRNASTTLMMSSSSSNLGASTEKISDVGCVLTAYTRIASAIIGTDIDLDTANKYAKDHNLFSKGNLLTPKAGEELINGLLEEAGITDTKVRFVSSLKSEKQDVLLSSICFTENFTDEYFITGRIETTNKDGSKTYGHHVNINQDAVFADVKNGVMNLSINDPNGVRKQLYHDSRSNKLLRFDLFKIIKTQPTGDE